MTHYRLVETLPSAIATDLATLLQNHFQERRLVTLTLEEEYRYEIATVDGGYVITETIGRSTDRMRLLPPIKGTLWRSDAYESWLTSAYERLSKISAS